MPIVTPKVKTECINTNDKEQLWKIELEVAGGKSCHLLGDKVERHEISDLKGTPFNLPSHRPLWMDVSFNPITKPQKDSPRYIKGIDGRKVEPLVVFSDDKRQILTDTSWPWVTIGKIFTSDGTAGSGVLVGDRTVLTARHVLPWNSIANGNWWMRFIPHYFDGNTTFGSSYVQSARYYDRSDVYYDYAVLKLDVPLGNQLGYLGYRSGDDWGGTSLTNVGYHADIFNGNRPAWQIYSIEDDYEDSDGQVLETEASLEHGSSGSPFFAWFDNQPQVVSVVSGGTGFPSGFLGLENDDQDNALSGGLDMAHLVEWARSNWPL